ncbi:phosphopyruvate hydratase [candidate division WWE3 bacterium CG_4_10_14_0_2_um_filter_41_14]|uniref:Enolase n=1 Tax=candidate division WWE3 bacterium CG_4_10_14_0_2_um_filter_41_14 TaxID=1975072 RepID=A0A2M7TI76_UNCKA|nr:MAG: phosphopyruvate hydratase [candidate division WWE3 bacterium CG_4_10_14_0_2_um_filter_41_14]
MILIDELVSRQILNSRGEPTIEVDLLLNDGSIVRSSVPSGKSRSTHEAVELVDKDFSKYFGKSVYHAISNINETISPRLKKLDPTEQFHIDKILLELDGTPNKAHLGGNATLAVSMAVSKAAALIKGVPLYEHLNELFIKVEAKDVHEEAITLPKERTTMALPIPSFNIINGGAHADTSVTIQEYMIVPVGIETMEGKIRAGAEIMHALKELLHKAGKTTNVGDEGGFAPSFDNNREPLEFLARAVSTTNYHLNNDVVYALDVAGAKVSDDFYDSILRDFPLISIEDAYGENDWAEFATLNEKYPDLFCTGDDITSTNVQHLYQAIKSNAVDCVIVKPNQIGTVTETLEFSKIAKDAGMSLFASHRSGETNDIFIVDLAIGLGAKFLKSGAPNRGERVAKYNHLLEQAVRFEG